MIFAMCCKPSGPGRASRFFFSPHPPPIWEKRAIFQGSRTLIRIGSGGGKKEARAYQQRCPVGSAIATCRVRRVARRNDERRGSPGGGVRRGSLGQGGGLVGERFAPGSRPPAKKFGLPEASVRYPFYPALFPRVARGSDPAPDPDPVSLPIISHRRGRECGGCHIRHAVDSRRARRPRRRGRGAPALRDGRRRSTVSARYTAHRGGERGPPHEREVARGVRAMRSRPTAAELELSVRASPAERRRADAGGEARGRRARGSPSFARRQPERRRARNVRHPAHGRRHLRPRGRPRASSQSRRRRRRRRAVGRPHRPRRRRRERLGRGATMLRDFTENRRRRQLCLRGSGRATPGLRRRPRRRRAHGLRHGPSPRRLRRGSEPAREKHGHQGCQVETSRRRARPLGRRRRRAKTRQHATPPRRRRLHQRGGETTRPGERLGRGRVRGRRRGHRRRPGRGRATRHRGCQDAPRMRRRPRRVRRGFHSVTHGGVGRSRGRRRSTHEKRRGRQRARAERIHHAVGSRREVRRRHHPRLPLRGRRRRGARRTIRSEPRWSTRRHG